MARHDGLASTGRLILADLAGRTRLEAAVDMAALRAGWGLDVSRTAGLSRGFYRARLTSGTAVLSCAVYLRGR